jgi:hypothetical protein
MPNKAKPKTRGKADRIITKAHRVSAGLFLLSMIPAGYASFKGDTASPLIYLPLPFLFALILTGIYQLVMPWIRRRQARGMSSGTGHVA